MDHPDVVLDVHDQPGTVHVGALGPDLAVVSLRVLGLHVVHQGSHLQHSGNMMGFASVWKSVKCV